MTEVVLGIKRWGNSLGVRLPAVIAGEAHLYLDQKVKLSVINNQVILSPVLDDDMSLDERLAEFDLKRHGGEVMLVGEALGSEKW